MRLQTAIVVGALVLTPHVVKAQGSTAPVPLTPATLARMIPLLKAEKARTLDASMRAAGLSTQTYTANKRSILIAQLDIADTTRFVKMPIYLKVRRINVAFLREVQDSVPPLKPDDGLSNGTLNGAFPGGGCLTCITR